MSGENLHKFKIGYIIAYQNDGSKFGNLIERKQLKAGFVRKHACYTHVEISLGEKHSIRIAPPKSKLIDITKQKPTRIIKLLRLKTGPYEDKRYKVGCLYASFNNTGYDIGGVLHFMFKWIKQNNRLHFCSEAVAEACKMVYPKLFPKEPSEYMPADFLSQMFEEIWTGTIAEI